MRRTRYGGTGASGVVIAALTVAVIVPAGAHAAAVARTDGCVAPTVAPRATSWGAPLDRRVTFGTRPDARELSLRDALDLLAERGRFRLSYAAELLPLDRRVCVVLGGARAVGDVLAALVGGAVEPVVVGDDHVVLAPRAAEGPSGSGADGVAPVTRAPHADAARVRVAETAHEIGRLAPVLVRGVARDHGESDDRAAVDARDVIAGAALGAFGTPATGGDALGGALATLPGLWRWAASPASLGSRWGSLRGASAFGAESPAIFVDGVEVANPLLFTSLVPDAVARVTVTRGPQGAARYGASAAGGVIEIETRHDGTVDGAPAFRLRSAAGPSRTALGASVLAQQHTLSVRAGSETRAAGLGVLFGTIGDFVPNGSMRELAAHGDARVAGARGAVTLAARVASKATGTTTDALAAASGATAAVAFGAGSARPFPATDSLAGEGQHSRQYTLAVTAAAGAARWTPEATIGVDGYRLTQGSSGGVPFRSSADSALHAARGGVDQLTARVRTVGRFGDATRHATVTLGAEHLVARVATAVDSTTRTSTALVAQSALAFRDALFVSGGARIERDAGGRLVPTLSLLPTLGAAVVHDVGGASLKLRAAYGRSVRSPNVGSVLGARPGARPLENESQTGVELGADVARGPTALHVTRFDQRASGLLQAVSPAAAASSWRVRQATVPRVALVNGGAVANRGWELRGVTRVGRLAVDAAYAAVDSRVTRVSPLAVGSALRAGDRMLDVPARTASLSLAWLADRWSFVGGASRASDWVGYDRLALANDLAASGSTPGVSLGTASATSASAGSTIGGDVLRTYRRDYTGATRLRASASRDLARGVALTLAGENLLGTQRGEPDALALVTGRTIALGVQAKF